MLEIIPDKKECPKCKEMKHRDEFWIDKVRMKISSWCKDCKKRANNERRRRMGGTGIVGRPRVNARNKKSWELYEKRKETALDSEKILAGLGWKRKDKYKSARKHWWLNSDVTVCGRTIDKGGFGVGEFEEKIADGERCGVCNTVIHRLCKNFNW